MIYHIHIMYVFVFLCFLLSIQFARSGVEFSQLSSRSFSEIAMFYSPGGDWTSDCGSVFGAQGNFSANGVWSNTLAICFFFWVGQNGKFGDDGV